MVNPVIAVLGRREWPTDGVEDFCGFLSQALGRRGVRTETVRVDWDQLGWSGALRVLREQQANWHGSWAVVNYTAMAWSRRGFPFGTLRVLAGLKRNGAHCAVLFHEAARQPVGPRLRDKIRGTFQGWVIRRAFRAAETAIFTVPLENVAWLPRNHAKAAYIPIGANIPERLTPESAYSPNKRDGRTVVVFCLDRMPALRRQLSDISSAVRVAQREGARFRLLFVGRGTSEARQEIAKTLGDIPIEVCVLGRLEPDAISDSLAFSDAMIFVRGRLNQCRGTALAAVACGLPLVAYGGEVESTPLAQAGVILVPDGDTDGLGAALARVLTDDTLAREMRMRSIRARDDHFSWDRIAELYVQYLGGQS